METFKEYAEKLDRLESEEMYENDFFLTWEKTRDELEVVFIVADTLHYLRENNISTKIFDSGLGISLFRDNSTRAHFSSASACNLLGLEAQDLGEGKNQISYGETVREAANMISFMADITGIRDDVYVDKGNVYMHKVSESVQGGYEDGVLKQRPVLMNLQCDIDHPTQATADVLYLIHESGGAENLRGEKVAITWAYLPSYGKPLSVPQGTVGLITRLGMDVVLAYPEGYEIISEIEKAVKKNVAEFGRNFTRMNSMAEVFKGADVVYPKNWTPFVAMERRTELYNSGNQAGIDQLEQELLSQNKKHKDWECTEELMKTTEDDKASYMHCLPVDITGVSCKEGEVEASVFDRYWIELHRETSYKSHVITAMIFLSKVKNPRKTLTDLVGKVTPREIR